MEDPYVFVVRAAVDVGARPTDVFDRVSDVTRFGAWSPECTGGEWVSDLRGVGARFLGHNRRSGRTWTTECEVLASERPSEFAWHVLTNTIPLSSVWRYQIEADCDRCHVAESFEMTATPTPLRNAHDRAPADRRHQVLELRKRELFAGIENTLQALKAELEANRPR
jgi:hypothetical protein